MAEKFNLDDYVTVNERLEKFYAKNPNGRVHTEILTLNDEKVVMRAKVWRDYPGDRTNIAVPPNEAPPSTAQDVLAFPDAIGHAEERRSEGYINKTSAVENCETSAIGRALAILGYEIKKSIASRDEVANAVEQQEELKKPISATNESNIYAMLKRLDISANDYEKELGRKVGEMTNDQGLEAMAKLKAAILRKVTEEKQPEQSNDIATE